eukprot:scaffold1415_cov117-Isochrysis_galbana.AAC.2
MARKWRANSIRFLGSLASRLSAVPSNPCIEAVTVICSPAETVDNPKPREVRRLRRLRRFAAGRFPVAAARFPPPTLPDGRGPRELRPARGSRKALRPERGSQKALQPARESRKARPGGLRALRTRLRVAVGKSAATARLSPPSPPTQISPARAAHRASRSPP